MKKRIRNYINLFIIILILANIFITAWNNTRATTKDEQVANLINEDLEISFIDVGQADSTLIRINDKYVLIDAGNTNDGQKLVNYFKSKNIEKFEYVIATHPHEDHIGGMKKIIDNFEIENFYMADVTTTTKLFENMLDAMLKKNITFKTFALMQKFNVDNAEFTCLSNLTDNLEDLNDASIVLQMVYYDTKYLFMADATNTVENAMLKYDLKSDLLKVSHHGSVYSSSYKFLSRVSPRYAVISVGKDNEYFLPHEKILQRLESKNVKVYRTDQSGTIIVKSDGKNIKISSIKTDTDGG